MSVRQWPGLAPDTVVAAATSISGARRAIIATLACHMEALKPAEVHKALDHLSKRNSAGGSDGIHYSMLRARAPLAWRRPLLTP